jgi:hypothetical protein
MGMYSFLLLLLRQRLVLGVNDDESGYNSLSLPTIDNNDDSIRSIRFN